MQANDHGSARESPGWFKVRKQVKTEPEPALGQRSATISNRNAVETLVGHIPKVARSSQPGLEGAIPLGLANGRGPRTSTRFRPKAQHGGEQLRAGRGGNSIEGIAH